MPEPTDGISVEIDNALNEVLRRVDNEMLTKWVLIAETIDSEGKPYYQILSAPNMGQWDVGGILLYAGKHFNEQNQG